MKDDEDFVVLRATIGARMQSGQSADGIARELWKQGYREKATTIRRQLKLAREALSLISNNVSNDDNAHLLSTLANSAIDAIRKEGEA